MAPDCQNDIWIPVLKLPAGLNEVVLAELVTSVLLRAALTATTPWPKWILLAALQLLQGRTPAPLSASLLNFLTDGVDAEDSVVNIDNQVVSKSTGNSCTVETAATAGSAAHNNVNIAVAFDAPMTLKSAEGVTDSQSKYAISNKTQIINSVEDCESSTNYSHAMVSPNTPRNKLYKYQQKCARPTVMEPAFSENDFLLKKGKKSSVLKDKEEDIYHKNSNPANILSKFSSIAVASQPKSNIKYYENLDIKYKKATNLLKTNSGTIIKSHALTKILPKELCSKKLLVRLEDIMKNNVHKTLYRSSDLSEQTTGSVDMCDIKTTTRVQSNVASQEVSSKTVFSANSKKHSKSYKHDNDHKKSRTCANPLKEASENVHILKVNKDYQKLNTKSIKPSISVDSNYIQGSRISGYSNKSKNDYLSKHSLKISKETQTALRHFTSIDTQTAIEMITKSVQVEKQKKQNKCGRDASVTVQTETPNAFHASSQTETRNALYASSQTETPNSFHASSQTETTNAFHASCQTETPNAFQASSQTDIQDFNINIVSQSVQTENYNAFHASSQTYYQDININLQSKMAIAVTCSEAQTLLIEHASIGIQTVKHRSKKWKLVSVSGLPVRAEPVDVSLEGSNGRGELFHGRPLNRSKDMIPPLIPLHAVQGLGNFISDPRLE